MEFSTICIDCLKEFREENFIKFKIIPNKENKYDFQCSNGHNIQLKLQIQKFQLLFLNSIEALKNEYFFESFLSLVACYERFLEYFIRIVLKSNNFSEDDVENFWKNMSKQSERQLGSFISCYALEFKTNPKILHQNLYSLRNEIIHKGIFPDREDCIKYGDGVLNFIRPTIKLLKDEKYEKIIGLSMWENDNKECFESFIPLEPFALNRIPNDTDLYSMEDYIR